MSILQKFEDKQIEKLQGEKQIPEFKAGDSVRVNVRIVEGNNERIQAFEGVCIARKNRGLNSTFVVRKISHGEGVERVFPLYSNRIESIELVRSGVVRRAKLYYLRGRTGKAARIAEKLDFSKKSEKPAAAAKPTKEAPKAEKPAEEAKAEESK